jgi:hypothetical protein
MAGENGNPTYRVGFFYGMRGEWRALRPGLVKQSSKAVDAGAVELLPERQTAVKKRMSTRLSEAILVFHGGFFKYRS